MSNALTHDSRKMYSSTTNFWTQQVLHRPIAISGSQRLVGFLAVVLVQICAHGAVATPLPEGTSSKGYDKTLLPREDKPSNNSGFSPKVWIPVVIVFVLLLFVTMLSWRRGIMHRGFGHLLSSTNLAAGNAPSTSTSRELTAEQLTGDTNSEQSNITDASNTRPARRNRRPRRTPSQISTISLPAYNKEPGEEELVIYRGPEAEEDIEHRVNTMPSVDEDGETSLLSADRSQVSRYSPMLINDSATNLLRDEYSGPIARRSLLPPGEDMPRRSYDTTASSHETSSLLRVDSRNDDESLRGEAPAYFEVVDPASPLSEHSVPRYTPRESPVANQISPPSSPPQAIPERRSGFRSLLHRTVGTIHGGSAHNRTDSESSLISTPAGRDGPSPVPLHRPSQSTSSGFSIFNSLSRQKPVNGTNASRLDSPSLISLDSISPPLTHTVVRTGFTYPRAGPTPEQLKLISSRESFMRFGMPYGADAVAFAASASLQDLEPPPPDFDLAASNSNLPRSPPGPSRLRSASNAADIERDENEASLAQAVASGSEGQDRTEEPSASDALQNGESVTEEHLSDSSEESLPASNSENLEAQKTTPEPTREGGTDSASTESPSSPTSTSVLSRVAKPSPLPSQKSPQEPPVNTEASSSTIPSRPSLYLVPSYPTSRSPSFARVDSSSSTHSTQSFETAVETPIPSPRASQTNITLTLEPDTPTTPTLGGHRHLLEPTDSTIVPSMTRTISA